MDWFIRWRLGRQKAQQQNLFFITISLLQNIFVKNWATIRVFSFIIQACSCCNNSIVAAGSVVAYRAGREL